MKLFEGIVVSTGMAKTAIVEITRRTPHPMYKKLMKRTKRYKADTAGITVALGDMVRIIETKPLSADKYFKIEKVLNTKAKEKQEEVKSEKVEVAIRTGTVDSPKKVARKVRKKKERENDTA